MKIFFSMAAILLINIATGDMNQMVIVANVAMALAVIELNLGRIVSYVGYDALGWRVVRWGRVVVKITVYCVNFYLFFS
jgi:hypothetical protein